MNKNKKITFAVGCCIILIIMWVAFSLVRPNGKVCYDAVFFGDSIIASDHSGVWDIPTLISNETGMTVLNAGFGGYTMSNRNTTLYPGDYRKLYSMIGLSESLKAQNFSMQVMASQEGEERTVRYFPTVSRELSSVDWKSVKYIFIEHAANDYLFGVPVDDAENRFNEYTFGGALRKSIENVREGAPNAEIILVTPIYMCPDQMPGDCFEADYGGGILTDYVDKELEIAEEYGVTVIDNFHEVDINSENFEELIPGGLHPNLEGNKLIAENICRHIREINE